MNINNDLKSAQILSGPFPEFQPDGTNPFQLFESSLKLALDSAVPEPSNMVLSTSSANQPDARIVLLKAVDDAGFYFETGISRTKVEQIRNNSNVSLTFYWAPIGRQIRIQGTAILTEDFSHVSDNLDAKTRHLNVYYVKPSRFEYYQALTAGGYNRFEYILSDKTWQYRSL